MKYTTLYTIELLHDYFTNGRAGDILFTPTEACAQTLRNIRAFTKTWQNKLYVIVPTHDGTHPAVPLPPQVLFEFYWQPVDARFLTYTEISLANGKRLYCQNAIAAERGGKKYLHPLHSLHNAAQSYSAGSLVSDGSGHCFEALANLSGGNNLGNASQWANRGAVAYLSADQLVTCSSGIPVLNVQPSDTAVHVDLFAFNPLTNFPDTLVRSDNFSHPAPVAAQAIDMRLFPAGLYRAVVNGTADQFIYLDSSGAWQAEMGIISIYHHATLPAANALTGPGGELLNPAFVIRLAPPAVIWQYKARTTAVKKVEDESGLIQFDAAAPSFTSKLPIRLQQQAYDKMVLEYNNTSPPDPMKTVVVKKLPVPAPGSYEKITKNLTNYRMATVLLNY